MFHKIKEINNRADGIAARLPLSLGKEDDEMKQICHFVLRYYDPILSLLEKQQLTIALKGSADGLNQDAERKPVGQQKTPMKEAERLKKEKLVEMSTPRGAGCSKITGKTTFKKEESAVAAIMKNSKARGQLTGEEKLAFWANSQKQKVHELKENLDSIITGER